MKIRGKRRPVLDINLSGVPLPSSAATVAQFVRDEGESAAQKSSLGSVTEQSRYLVTSVARQAAPVGVLLKELSQSTLVACRVSENERVDKFLLKEDQNGQIVDFDIDRAISFPLL